MTDEEWRTSADPEEMLRQLRRLKALRTRPWRLFACACCRRIWDKLDGKARRAVEVTEDFAQRKATDADRALAVRRIGSAEGAAVAAVRLAASPTAYMVTDGFAAHRRSLDAAVAGVRGRGEATRARAAERVVRADLIREVFGNPFRVAMLDPSWLAWNGGLVERLARSIMDERAWDRLPVLGDALEEAGCTDADILAHCRGPGPHVLGCWVVDLLLRKR